MTQPVEPARLLLVDDKAMRRASLASLVQDWASAQGLRLSHVASSAAPRELSGNAPVRAIVVSVGATSVTSDKITSLLRMLSARAPDAAVVVLSDRMDASETIAAFRSGTRGYIPTGLGDRLALEALGFVIAGGTYFPPSVLAGLDESQTCDTGVERATSAVERQPDAHPSVPEPGMKLTLRQHDVLLGLGRGEPNKVIARRLGLTEATVKLHVRQIMRKLGASNRTQAAVIARTS